LAPLRRPGAFTFDGAVAASDFAAIAPGRGRGRRLSMGRCRSGRTLTWPAVSALRAASGVAKVMITYVALGSMRWFCGSLVSNRVRSCP